MSDTEDGTWTPGNGWGVQVRCSGSKGDYWDHATDRAIIYSRREAMMFADGMRRAQFDGSYRVVDPDGKVTERHGPHVEEAQDG